MDEKTDSPVYSERMLTQMQKGQEKYADIMTRPHPVSVKHKPMPVMDRAAQFSPFSALTGHDANIRIAEEQFARQEADSIQREQWTQDCESFQ